MYSREHLSSLDRKKLQALAKECGLKANAATGKIIEDLLQFNSPKIPCESAEIKEEMIPKVFTVGSSVVASIDGTDQDATVVKINKKTVKIQLEGGAEIITVQTSQLRVSSKTTIFPVSDELSSVSEVLIETETDKCVPFDTSCKEIEIDESIEFNNDEQWVNGKVVKVNKKTFRVRDGSGKEFTIGKNLVRRIVSVETTESIVNICDSGSMEVDADTKVIEIPSTDEEMCIPAIDIVTDLVSEENIADIHVDEHHDDINTTEEIAQPVTPHRAQSIDVVVTEVAASVVKMV